MHYRMSCLVLLFAFQLDPICAFSQFLASRKSEEMQRAKENLRAQTARLTNAIRQELGRSTPLPVVVEAVRSLLGEEAGKAWQKDPVGAKLLRQFAKELSPESLELSHGEVVLSAESKSNQKAFNDALNDVSSSIHRKAQKNRRKAVRRAQKEKARQAREAARKAVRDLDKAMREMQQSFGDEGFSSILRDLLAAKHKKQIDSSNDEISQSSSTVIQDGRLVRETKECRNGKCTTSVEEHVIGNNPGPAEEHNTSTQKEQPIDERAEEAASTEGTPSQNQANEIILVGANPPVVPW